MYLTCRTSNYLTKDRNWSWNVLSVLGFYKQYLFPTKAEAAEKLVEIIKFEQKARYEYEVMLFESEGSIRK